MGNKFQQILAGRRVLIYFIILFGILTFFFRTSFTNPPRSDYWPLFYVFQKVEASPESPSWVEIMNHDPWRHGTFRPLAHLILYWEYQCFGTGFFWNHLLNFMAYCLSIVLLYLLARQFGLNRHLTLAFLTVFAFLFSHFDIVTWTFQIFTIIAFSTFLLGFILYGRFLKNQRIILLPAVGGLFVLGLFCSESVMLWPLALLFFHHSSLSDTGPAPPKRRAGTAGSCLLLIISIYLIYGIGLLLTRALPILPARYPVPMSTRRVLPSAWYFSIFFIPAS